MSRMLKGEVSPALPGKSSFRDDVPGLCPRYPTPMDRGGEERRGGTADGGRRSLLSGQLDLLDVKREVRALRERGKGGSHRGEALANDLVGIRLVLCAALLSQGLAEAEREGLERLEREAREMLREAIKT